MRGLTVFIADLRKCRVRDAEAKRVAQELAHIRAKFRDPKLSGYNRKKYVAKLLYCHTLGYTIDFGHAEALRLIHSNVYSEKSLGYLASTLMISETDELARMLINSVRNDLGHSNEMMVCVALNAIANFSAAEMLESVLDDVVRLLFSSGSRSFVCKKAALCVLKAIRKRPDLDVPNAWLESLETLFAGHTNFGVLESLSVLMLELTQSRGISSFTGTAIDRAYDVCCHLGPSFHQSTDKNDKLIVVLEKLLDMANHPPRNFQHSNAQHAILIEAVRVMLSVNDASLLKSAMDVVLRFISSREPNLRCVGLDLARTIAGHPEVSEMFRHQLDHVMLIIHRDQDEAVQFKALSLLLVIADSTHAMEIVERLQERLLTQRWEEGEDAKDLRIHTAMITAMISEQCIDTDRGWVVWTMLNLISQIGIGSEPIAHRVEYLASTLNEQDQEKVAKLALSMFNDDANTENDVLLRTCVYIFGEFGSSLFTTMSDEDILQQSQGLFRRLETATPQVKAVILTALSKLFAIDDVIRPQVLHVMSQYTRSIDAELRQRAIEFVTLASISPEALVEVFSPIPELSPRLAPALCLADDKQGSSFGSTWMPSRVIAKADDSFVDEPDLLDLNDATGDVVPIHGRASSLDAGLFRTEGVLFRNELVQVSYSAHFFTPGAHGRILVDLVTLGACDIDQVDASVQTPSGLVATLRQGQKGLEVDVSCHKPFSELATFSCTLSFQNHLVSPVTFQITLPITLARFIFPNAVLSLDLALSMWNQLESPNPYTEFDIECNAETVAKMPSVLELIGLTVLESTAGAVIAVGECYTMQFDRIQCLVKCAPTLQGLHVEIKTTEFQCLVALMDLIRKVFY